MDVGEGRSAPIACRGILCHYGGHDTPRPLVHIVVDPNDDHGWVFIVTKRSSAPAAVNRTVTTPPFKSVVERLML